MAEYYRHSACDKALIENRPKEACDACQNPKAKTWADAPGCTIPADKYHPAADSAMAWLKRFMLTEPAKYLEIKEAIYSTALSNNDMSNYCVGTIERLAAGAPVSDRYLLGLAWVVRQMADQPDAHIKSHITRPGIK